MRTGTGTVCGLLGAVGLLAAGISPGSAAEDPLSIQEVILRVKPATVLVVSEVVTEVTVNCGAGDRRVTPSPFRETGTGWFVDSNGWIMTNAHVVQPAHQPPRWLINEQAEKGVVAACVWDALARQGVAPGQQPDLEERMRRQALVEALPGARVEAKPSIFVLLSNGFRLPAKVAKYSPPVSTQLGAAAMSGRDLALLQVEAAEMPSFKLAESKHVKIGDPIHILGFPGVVLTHELLNSTAKVEASVTNGAVSGFKQDVQGQPVIQTDAPAAWGNSGGPAVNSRGDIVGVLTFVSLAPGPQGGIVQGFNFVIPADAVKEFLQGTGVDLADRSPFNERWFTGLRRFFSDDPKAAAIAFRAADQLQPEFPDVRRMLVEAEEKIKNPPPRPVPWPMVMAGITVLGIGVSGVVYGRRSRARRLHVSPTEVLRLIEGGATPVLLDARAPLMFRASPFRLPGAIRLSPDDAAAAGTLLGIEPVRPVVVYCTCKDQRSSILVARQLRGQGYTNVRILEGGLGGWTGAGLALEPKPVGDGEGPTDRPTRSTVP